MRELYLLMSSTSPETVSVCLESCYFFTWMNRWWEDTANCQLYESAEEWWYDWNQSKSLMLINWLLTHPTLPAGTRKGHSLSQEHTSQIRSLLHSGGSKCQKLTQWLQAWLLYLVFRDDTIDADCTLYLKQSWECQHRTLISTQNVHL